MSAREDDLFRVEAHLGRVRACERDWRGLRLPTATPPGQRYPLVYPRDTAAIVRAWDRLARLGQADADEAARALHAAAAFLLEAQGEDGLWGQRYDLDARDRSLYPQEDNVAHAVAALARHVRRARQFGAASPLERDALDAIRRALDEARGRLLSEERGLYWSTTSVHESAIERGYTLWTNGAFHDALRLASEAARVAGRARDADAWARERARHAEAIRRHLVLDGAFLARRMEEGAADLRADVTLLAPTYFGFEALAPEAAERARGRVERELRDARLGLPRRHLPDPRDLAIHLHGGDGPYLSFSGWLAQAHAQAGDAERAMETLSRIASCAGREGSLPEHVATMDAFASFFEREWLTGLDARKEFDKGILLPGVGMREMLAEAARMVEAYRDGLEEAEKVGDGVVRTALPHAWAHAEFALALAMAREVSRSDAAPTRARASR